MGDTKGARNDTRTQQRGGGAGASGKRKACYGNSNPKRGGAGFLLTCETGRERKCKREGLDIISHYYSRSCLKQKKEEDGTATSIEKEDAGTAAAEEKASPTSTTAKKELTLEEEIVLLQGGASADQVLVAGAIDSAKQSADGKKMAKEIPFKFYDTGCRGMALYLAEPETNLSNDVEDSVDDTTKSETNVETAAKKQKVNEEENGDEGNAISTTFSNKWDNYKLPSFDPVPLVKDVMDDVLHPDNANARAAPRSRFLTRLIPVQATCYADLNEIRILTKKLKEQHVADVDSTKTNDSNKEAATRQPTFGVQFKQRFSSKVKRLECIEAIAENFHPTFKVDLSNPDYLIMVEICKTVVCMSIFKDYQSSIKQAYHNFNLSILSDKVQEQSQEEEKAGEKKSE
jgi:tRNA acetyltransferase TAN1